VSSSSDAEDDVVGALRSAANRHGDLSHELVKAVRERAWTLAIAAAEIRTTWAKGFSLGSLPATPVGYVLADGGVGWYLFTSKSERDLFDRGRQELVALELPGAVVFRLALTGEVAELTVNPGSRPFNLQRAHIETLGRIDERAERTGSVAPPTAPSRVEIELKLAGLIDGTLTREEASDWARPWATRYEGLDDRAMQEALELLYTADSPTIDRPYLYGNADFEAWLRAFRKSAAPEPPN
jgi:hypothetical protein